jgi:hypothetical protein
MGWWQVQDIEYADYEPARVVRVRKMIWDDSDRAFRTHYFLRVHCESETQRQKPRSGCRSSLVRLNTRTPGGEILDTATRSGSQTA